MIVQRRLVIFSLLAELVLLAMIRSCTSEMIPRGQVSNLTTVYKRILEGYDRRQRPFYKVKPENIKVGLYIKSFSHVSEQNMEFQAYVHIHQIWEDPRLAFGDANDSIVLQGDEVDSIWLPDIFVVNARKMHVGKNDRYTIITGNGTVYYWIRTLLTLAVDMDLRNYPMDEQNLMFVFESYTHTASMFNVTWLPTMFQTKEFAAFYLVSYKHTASTFQAETGEHQKFILSTKAKRRLGYFVVQFYFPCTVCSVISWFPFFMDRYAIGDRVALSITTLLTEMFLFQYINSAMPQVSYIKAADEYIMVSFLLSFFALLENILVYLYRDDVKRKKSKRDKNKERTEERTEEVSLSPSNNVALGEIGKSTAHAWHDDQPNHQPSARSAKELDISKFIDQASRVVFPVGYIVFVLAYFVKGLTYYN